MVEYKFNEKRVLKDLVQYIDSTYEQHYTSESKFQATDAIIESGHGVGFCVGNILKYAWRFGKKDGNNINDLYKAIHYAIIAIHIIKYKNMENQSAD